MHLHHLSKVHERHPKYTSVFQVGIKLAQNKKHCYKKFAYLKAYVDNRTETIL